MKKVVFRTFMVSLCFLTVDLLHSQIVTSGADDGSDGTLRVEIADAGDGGVVTFDPAVTSVTLNSEIDISFKIQISGPTDGNVDIDAGLNGRIFNIDGDTLALSDLTLMNGLAEDGGGILVTNGHLSLVNCTVTNCTADGASGSGGAVFLGTGSSINSNGTDYMDNTANRAGGALEIATEAGNAVLILQGEFNGNSAGVAPAIPAPGNGGALHVTGDVNLFISGCDFDGNLAASEGGGLWNGLGSMTVGSCFFQNNVANGDDADNGGGAIFNNGGFLQASATTISNNSATGVSGSGGGIFSTDGDLVLSGVTIFNNQANRAGGGVELIDGSLTMSADFVLNGNDAGGVSEDANPGNGGGLHVSGNASVDLQIGLVNGNTAAREGGGLWNSSGEMIIDDVSFSNNFASGNAADDGGGSIFNNGGTLTISNSSIQNSVATGDAGSGGGIFNFGGALDISNSTMEGNAASRAGGAIEVTAGSTTTISECQLNENGAGVFAGDPNPGNGGAIHVSGDGAVDIIEGMISDNTAFNEGGGVWNGSGVMTIDGTIISSNQALGDAAENGGGGVYNNGGALTISNADISFNVAIGESGSGGGILNNGGDLMLSSSAMVVNISNRAGGAIEGRAGGSILIDDCMVTDNGAGLNNGLMIDVVANPGNGGALHLSGETDATVINSTIADNLAASEGGGLWNSTGTMSVENTSLTGNLGRGDAADNGGGALFNNGGTLTVTDVTIEGNEADGDSGSGGGLLSTAGQVTVIGSSFLSNAANRAGGAIEIVDGSLSFINSTMGNNEVNGSAGTPAPGNGGGLHVSGMTTTTDIAGSTIFGNDAANEGGGLWNQSGSTMFITRSTVTGNTSPDGGGVFNNGGTVEINAVTLDGNASANGGAISSIGTTTVTNTILLSNGGELGPNLAGSITSLGYNLIGGDDVIGIDATETDVVAFDPMLGFLDDNGGPTPTLALLEGSPAIDAGNPNDLFADQRGAPPIGTRDIGAFEFGGTLDGCTDMMACNYNAGAVEDDGSCVYATGCDSCSGETDGTGAVVDNPEVGDTCDDMDPGTLNDVVLEDCTCAGTPISGCTDETACNYFLAASVDDGSCIYATGCDTCAGEPDGTGVVIDNPEVGESCDDMDPNTENDIVLEDCSCEGTLIEVIDGCTDDTACNYNMAATDDDGSCVFATGCDTCSGETDGTGTVVDNPEVGETCDDMDPDTENDMVIEDCSCEGTPIVEGEGCMDQVACNFDITATIEDGSCIYATGCDTCSGETDGTGTVIDNPEVGESCDDNDPTTDNDTVQEDCSCQGTPIQSGCTDASACNYDEAAISDDGSCVYATGCDTCSGETDGTGTVVDNPEVGEACDDMNVNTIDDEVNEDCVCEGTVVVVVPACTDAAACNFDQDATEDDGSCVFASGCDTCSGETDGTGVVVDNPEVGEACDDNDPTTIDDTVQEDCSCEGTPDGIPGCTDETACNYDPMATIDDGSCTIVTSASIATEDPTTICVGDGIPDPIIVFVTGGIGIDAVFVITDATTGQILGLMSGPMIDLDGAGEGACNIFHLNYDGDATTGLMVGFNIADLEGCFALSNPITVMRNGGGCTDPTAANFDPDACFDDGSCVDDECMTEMFDSQVSGWQSTGLILDGSDGFELEPLESTESIVPLSGVNAEEVVAGTFIDPKYFVGLDGHFHGDFSGPGYNANTNWADWGPYISSLPSDNTTALFDLSGIGEEMVLAFRWIAFIDANDDGMYDSSEDYLGMLDENMPMLPTGASGRLYVAFSDRLGQYDNNLGILDLTYCGSGDEGGVQEALIAEEGLFTKSGAAVVNSPNIYPNPSQDRFVISSEVEMTKIEVLDIAGRTVNTGTVSNNMTRVIGLGDQNDGVYLIRITYVDGTVGVSRVTLQK